MFKTFSESVTNTISSKLIDMTGTNPQNARRTFDHQIYTKQEAERVLMKYPDRIPVIVCRSSSANTSTPQIDKHKFLVPRELTVGQFLYVIRKRIRLAPDLALFIFVGESTPATSALMSTVYDESHDELTHFLFVTYSMESTFG